MVPNCSSILRLEEMLEQYWQYSLLKMTQIKEVRKTPAAYKSHITMRLSLISLCNVFQNSLNRHKEKRVNQQSELCYGCSESVIELRLIPSTIREQYKSMMTSIMFRLSQISRQMYSVFGSLTRWQRYSRLREFWSFIMRREAIISMRKVMAARQPRVQQQQGGISPNIQTMKEAATKPIQSSTRGPSLRMVVSMYDTVKVNSQVQNQSMIINLLQPKSFTLNSISLSVQKRWEIGTAQKKHTFH